MFQQTYTIAKNTFTEAIRQPVFVVLVMLGCLLLILNTFLSAYTLDDDNKMLIDMGLSTLLLAGLLFATVTATGAMSEEIENRTALTVVSKPVSRPVFVLGKYSGILAAIMLAVYVLSIVFLLTLRHKVMQSAADEWDFPVIIFGFGAVFLALIVGTLGNYMYRWVFPSTFTLTLAALITLAYVLVLHISPEWEFQATTAEFTAKDSQLGQLLVVMFLVFEAIFIIAAIAVACSTRLGQVMTLMICGTFFLLGLVSESVFGEFLENFDPVKHNAVLGFVLTQLARVFYACIPNLQFLWQADALTNFNIVSGSHVAYLTLYSFLQVSAFLGLAIALFQTREVG